MIRSVPALFLIHPYWIRFVHAALEPIQEDIESDESVVIPCRPFDSHRSVQCGSQNTAATVVGRAIWSATLEPSPPSSASPRSALCSDA